MLYMHDVWVNWFEGEENGYNVCGFHEWRKEDGVELIDQIPLILVTDQLFQLVLNDLHDLPFELLEDINQRAFAKKNQERHVLEYAAVITDGEEVMAFDTIGYTLPVKKTRLIPRQERLALDMIAGRKPAEYQLHESDGKEYHILSLSPEAMLGLTRRERQLKQLLMMALDQLQHSDHPEEIRYWLTEWNPGRYATIKDLTLKDAWTLLYEGTMTGWSERHEELCGKLIKGQPFFENIWYGEQKVKEAQMKSRN
ncbi:DUF3603 family protein [Thalassobacillus sp. CUG 92003]|uniref:DUF3603 family protein n=1 Tax=Thalassobacillus sp. CUG 92003 TaxID=2736641 RepID=UPI0015E7C87E|nr:DUF3603 family protein [Thalassobacillus sp. CUG 92003]